MLACQRDRFSLSHDEVYLNCAYMAPLSRRVVEAGVEGVRRKERPASIAPADFFSGPDRVRELFARLVGTGADRVAIIPSVSYGMAVVARNTSLESGQHILTLARQFPSHVYPWRRLAADTGAEVRVVGPPPGTDHRGRRWNEAILEAIGPRTALVAVPPVHWTDGTIFDLEAIGRRAREVEAALVVDGTQSVGAHPFDCGRVQPDALVCAGYKWLTGPYAIGAMVLGERYAGGVPLEETWIGRRGSEHFGGLVDYQDRYRDGAARFDMGEGSNFILIPMFIAALEQVLEWTVDGIAEYCARICAPAVQTVTGRGFGVEEESWRAPHLFGIRLPDGLDPEAVRDTLAERRISVSVRGGVIRVAPHVYNTEADLEACAAALIGLVD